VLNDRTWTVRYTDTGGAPQVLDDLTDEAEARDMEKRLEADSGGEFQDVVAFDRLAETVTRFPVGAKVRHRDMGMVGTVVGEHRVLRNWAPSIGRTFPEAQYWAEDQIRIHFPGHSTMHWVAGYLELVED
jgi:hypothetical protein